MKSLNKAVEKKKIEVVPSECSRGLVICIRVYQWQGNRGKVETHKPVWLWQATECLMEFQGTALLWLPESALS